MRRPSSRIPAQLWPSQVTAPADVVKASERRSLRELRPDEPRDFGGEPHEGDELGDVTAHPREEHGPLEEAWALAARTARGHCLSLGDCRAAHRGRSCTPQG